MKPTTQINVHTLRTVQALAIIAWLGGLCLAEVTVENGDVEVLRLPGILKTILRLLVERGK